ncbi:hypothetical protein PFLmoz3_03857 [Pseudomonas fluorescens]|uniref:Uncharacterized protein n=1 Tax=Pseudomonas fluorescens TaxID=294 RepID=A0A125QI35_PSEFL|nr:hypothetical protein PFLmoz3_03857 [Pseudomonas fluorescens]
MRNKRPPGTSGTSLRRRSITAWAEILRSPSGLRRTSITALLVPWLPPIKPATLSTAGSLSTAWRKISIFGCMTLNDRPSSPRTKPINWPVSCWGMKVLGTTTYSAIFTPTVTNRLSKVRRRWRSTQSRLVA